MVPTKVLTTGSSRTLGALDGARRLHQSRKRHEDHRCRCLRSPATAIYPRVL